MAGFALAGRLAPLIAKAGSKLGGALGKGQGAQADAGQDHAGRQGLWHRPLARTGDECCRRLPSRSRTPPRDGAQMVPEAARELR